MKLIEGRGEANMVPRWTLSLASTYSLEEPNLATKSFTFLLVAYILPTLSPIKAV
jgi:hypothetical protein